MKKAVLIIMVLGLLLLAGCEEITWRDIICAGEGKNSFARSMLNSYCGRGGGGTISAENCDGGDGRYIWNPITEFCDYCNYGMILSDSQCFQVKDYIYNGGDVEACDQLDIYSEEIGERELCFTELGSYEKCYEIDDTSARQSCLTFHAESGHDCVVIDYAPDRNLCAAITYKEGSIDEHCKKFAYEDEFGVEGCKNYILLRRGQ